MNFEPVTVTTKPASRSGLYLRARTAQLAGIDNDVDVAGRLFGKRLRHGAAHAADAGLGGVEKRDDDIAAGGQSALCAAGDVAVDVALVAWDALLVAKRDDVCLDLLPSPLMGVPTSTIAPSAVISEKCWPAVRAGCRHLSSSGAKKIAVMGRLARPRARPRAITVASVPEAERMASSPGTGEG